MATTATSAPQPSSVCATENPMDTPELLTHFNRLADAPGAIPRLRRLVLDLAVRGKLVAQDPGDEPVNAKEDGSIKPFPIPVRWRWCQLGAIALVARGGSPRPINAYLTEEPDGIPWIKIGDATRGETFIDSTAEKIKPSGLAKSRLVEPGDLLLSNSMSFGFPYITNVRGCIHDGWLVIRAKMEFVDKIYLHRLFLSSHAVGTFSIAAAGAVVQNLNADKVRQLLVPLPPLAEQHRIVAKVDELMGLLDQIEARQTAREATRRQLTAASLARLSTSDTSPDELRDHARFLLDYLPAHTTRRDQIKQLRQTILNLAVRGRLVPQFTHEDFDESTVTRRVDAPFSLPESWRWGRLGDFVTASDSGWSPRTESHPREGNNWGVVKVSAVSWGEFRAHENKQLLPGTHPPLQATIRRGDFLMSRANTAELVARAVIVEEKPANLIMSDKIVRLTLSDLCVPRFIWLVNNYAEHARDYYAVKATGVSPSMKNVSREVILNLPVPIPPLAEQHRIVAKVNELMTLCDHLDAALDRAEAHRTRLLDAALHALQDREAARTPNGVLL